VVTSGFVPCEWTSDSADDPPACHNLIIEGSPHRYCSQACYLRARRKIARSRLGNTPKFRSDGITPMTTPGDTRRLAAYVDRCEEMDRCPKLPEYLRLCRAGITP